MYSTKIGLDAQRHDEFIRNSKLPNLLQSSNWAKVKDNWGSEIIGFFKDEELVASCLVLIRPLPAGFSMLYLPRGLAVDYEDKELLAYMFSELKKFGKTKKALFAKIDPAIQFEAAQGLISSLEKLGLDYTGRTQDMHETIQPRFNAVIYKRDFAEADLDKKTRQFLRKARNSHTEVEFGGKTLISDFAELMKKTEDRKKVSLRNADYYSKLLELYGDEAYITLIKMNLAELIKDAEQNLTKLQDNLAKAQNPKRQKSLQNEIEIAQKSLSELQKLQAEKGDLAPVAGTLTINSFGAAETLYAGTDTDFQKYYPSYLAWFETVQHAFETGADTLNMGGLENSLSESDGLLKFKKHFNPRIEEYVGEFDLPINRLLYKASKWAYNFRKKH